MSEKTGMNHLPPAVTFSYEIFPPKTESSKKNLYPILGELAALKPEYISVTCGAGGTDNRNNYAVCDHIQNTLNVRCMAHMCCIGQTTDTIARILDEYEKMSVNSLLALRGDFGETGDRSECVDFKFAVDLVRYIRNRYPRHNISVAGYPEGHNQNPSKDDDFRHQLSKANSGADSVITQLFFENRFFIDYYDDMKKFTYMGDIIPGIFPVINSKQVIKISGLCGSSIPKRMLRACEKYQDDPASMEAWGVDYAIGQIESLVKANHNRIHLYTMNQSRHIAEIASHFNRCQ